MARTLRQVTAVGNSLGVTLPRDFLEIYGLGKGALVEVRAAPEGILILPAKVVSAFTPDGGSTAEGTERRHRIAAVAGTESRRPIPQIAALMQELKTGLAGRYGARLKGVYYYGSYARGEQDPESDLDVLVVLDRLDDYGAEVDRTGHLISELSLKYGVSISRVFVSAQDWRNHRGTFLANVHEEAVPA